jgi:nucleoside-diphosphate-sugar epimerase
MTRVPASLHGEGRIAPAAGRHAVVTGGAGFLGSHLCDYLLQHGYEVTCIDNLETGGLQNIEHIEVPGPVDVVFHLASPASPIDYLRLPLHTMKVGSYVDDLVRGLVPLAEPGEHLPVNIGNPDEYTLLELAEAVLTVTGSMSEIVFEELPVDDPQVRQPDVTRAPELLGWKPTVGLEEGLRRTLAPFEPDMPLPAGAVDRAECRR